VRGSQWGKKGGHGENFLSFNDPEVCEEGGGGTSVPPYIHKKEEVRSGGGKGETSTGDLKLSTTNLGRYIIKGKNYLSQERKREGFLSFLTGKGEGYH